MADVSTGSPSPLRSFHKDASQNKNAPAPTMGTRTEKSAVPPCLPGRPGHSPRCQHTGCPITQATRQKILGERPFPSALGGPFAAPLFALLSALQNSLWMRLQFDFRLKGLVFFVFLIKLQFCLFVKNFFPSWVDYVQTNGEASSVFAPHLRLRLGSPLRNGAAAPLAPPLGELSPQVTERASAAGYPLRRLIAASSPKGRAKGWMSKAVTNRESPMV